MGSSLKEAVYPSFLLAIGINLIKGHDDLEGYCAAVLPAYNNNDEVEIKFVRCECEDSHYGKDQTLVVCTYVKILDNTTGSCNVKYCLFTQNCGEPENFHMLDFGVNAFDISLFDGWCVEKYSEQKDNIHMNPTNYPTAHDSLYLDLVKNATNSTILQKVFPSEDKIMSHSSGVTHPQSHIPFDCTVFITTLILLHAIIIL